MKSELVPLNGDPPIPITRDLTVIGRREYCDISIADPSLSKQHCVLVRTDGLLMVRDLVSTNGTKVNGQRVSWAALLPNDRLAIGRYKVRIYLGPDNQPSPSEQLAKQKGITWSPNRVPTTNTPQPPTRPLGTFPAPTPPDGIPSQLPEDPTVPPTRADHRSEPEFVLPPGDSDDELFQLPIDL